jgi:hypothetical protein
MNSKPARSAVMMVFMRHARDELLATVGSWGDTMDDARTLDHLRAFNRNGTIFSKGRLQGRLVLLADIL